MITFFGGKEAAVQYVVNQAKVLSTLTTATLQEKSVDYYVEIATEVLDTLKMMRGDFSKRSNISTSPATEEVVVFNNPSYEPWLRKKMEFKPIQYLCECKKEVLQSKYEGEFCQCSCGKCFVDQTRHYTRGGGGVVSKDEFENSAGFGLAVTKSENSCINYDLEPRDDETWDWVERRVPTKYVSEISNLINNFLKSKGYVDF